MLRVTFTKFRCWDNLSVEANLGSITLIRGNSGAGKSTIFHGIVWCLYGNLRLVTPNHDPKAKTRVVLEIPYNEATILTIDRQKNPNRLIVTQNNTVYEDLVAQSIIDNFFGSYEIWSIASYISQGSRNGFLTASNSGKMEILNKIAFLDDDPSIYIDKIEETINSTEINYKSQLALLTANVQKVQTLIQNININYALSEAEKVSTIDEMNRLIGEYSELEKVQKERDINLGILKDLQNQLTRVHTQLIQHQHSMKTIVKPDLPEGISFSIESLMDEIPKLQRRDDLMKQIIQIETLLKGYSRLPEGPFTIDDYRDTIQKESEYGQQKALSQSLGVPYNEAEIQETIRKYELVLELQDRVRIRGEQQKIREQIRFLEAVPKIGPMVLPEIVPIVIEEPDYVPFKTDELTALIAELSHQKGSILTHIEHLEKGRNVIQCPHCKGSVRYQNGILIPSDDDPIDQKIIDESKQSLYQIQTQIIQTQQLISTRQHQEAQLKRSYDQKIFEEQQRIKQLTERRRQLELEHQKRAFEEQTRIDKLATLMSQLILEDNEPIPEYIRLLNPNEIQRSYQIIAQLSSIQVLTPPLVSSTQIQSYLKYHELKDQKGIIQTIYEEQLQKIHPLLHKVSVNTLNLWIQKLREYERNMLELNNESTRLNKLNQDITAQIETLRTRIGDDPKAIMENKLSVHKELEEKLKKSDEAELVLQEHERVTKEREVVVRIQERLGDLCVLKQHAIETECTILQEITDQLNDSIQSICSSLFDRDITIGLSLYKTLKSTKHVKPLVNFNIAYQGGQFDNINQISGGEGDRVSLALTLALNRLSMSPLIMFDESLSSLDLTMKEVAIRTIREHTNNTVLIIMHDGIEGIFDNVVNIDDI